MPHRVKHQQQGRGRIAPPGPGKGRAIIFARALIAIALGGLLAACAQTPSLPKLDFEVNPDLKGEWVELDYITAYGLVTRGINQCWLAKKKPLYKSEVETRTNNKQNKKRADIFIQGAGKGKQKGPRIISVHLVARGADATEVSVDNRLLDPTTGKWFQRDIRHFLKGGQDCPVHKAKGGIEPKKEKKERKGEKQK